MKRLHAFLLTLLMLTVPLQAMAGKLLSCENRHAALTASSMMAEPEMHTVALHGQDDHQLHHLSFQSGMDAPDKTFDHVSGNILSAEQHAGSCSACASCTLASVAIATETFQLPSVTVASSDVAYLAFHIPETDPDLPDDPPRA